MENEHRQKRKGKGSQQRSNEKFRMKQNLKVQEALDDAFSNLRSTAALNFEDFLSQWTPELSKSLYSGKLKYVRADVTPSLALVVTSQPSNVSDDFISSEENISQETIPETLSDPLVPEDTQTSLEVIDTTVNKLIFSKYPSIEPLEHDFDLVHVHIEHSGEQDIFNYALLSEPCGSHNETQTTNSCMMLLKERRFLPYFLCIYAGPGHGKTQFIRVNKHCGVNIYDIDRHSGFVSSDSILVTSRLEIATVYRCVALISDRPTWNRRVKFKCSDFKYTWYDEMVTTLLGRSFIIWSNGFLEDKISVAVSHDRRLGIRPKEICGSLPLLQDGFRSM